MTAEDRAPGAGAPPTPVTIDDVLRAADRLRGAARRTPVLTSRTLDECVGGRVLLKCENFQRVGAFKFRGAYNAMAALVERDPAARSERGVLTWSSGNHAQALALASRLLSVRAVIVMPEDAPAVKRAATEGYLDAARGSRVVTYDRATQVREEVGAAIARDEGLEVIPPYDHPDVIAGQGTAGLELLEEAAGLDELFVCVGGGGLLSGCAIAARALEPGCRVVGVEPSAGDDAARSFATGRLHTVREPATICDGARTPSLGRWTFPLVLANADEVRTTPDDHVIRAMRTCYERLKIVVEPTGALALAGVFDAAAERPDRFRGKTVGVLVSGGNVDVARLGELFAHA